MKVKVKGLVFVGFAAAILSANAALADPDNTVTSKAYVDAKFQTKANLINQISSENPSSTEYPSESAIVNYVTTAGGEFQTKSTTAQQVSDGNGGWQALTTTATPAENSTTPFTAGGAYTLGAAKEDVSNKTQTVAATGSTSPDKYPSETAVRAAITAAAGDYQTKSTTAQQVSDGNGGWQALTKDTTVTENSTNPVTSGAVYAAIDALDGDYQAKSTTAQQVSDGNGGWQALTTTATPTENSTTPFTAGGAYTLDQAKVDVAQGAGNANKTLVTDANGNVTVSSQATSVVPAVPNGCDATHPCVLTNDTTDGSLVWVPIQQAE